MLAEPQDPRRRWLAAGPSCMPGNVIDLTFFNDYLIVSVDNIHKLDSTTDIDESDVRVNLCETEIKLFRMHG